MIWTTLPRSRITPAVSGWQDGEGPHLLLIHGVGLRAEAWSAMLPDLCRHFTVTAIDMPGHGQSAPLARDIPTLSDYVTAIGEVLSILPGQVAVAGHSMGALIATDLAIRFPSKVSRVCGLNMIFRRSPEAGLAVRARAEALPENQIADPAQTLQRWFGPAPKGELQEGAMACRNWLTAMNPKSYRDAYRVFANEDGPADNHLREMLIPALFMTGSNEPNSTDEMSRALAAMAPNGQYSVIDGAAHMMPMTHGNEVASRLINFLAGRGDTS